MSLVMYLKRDHYISLSLSTEELYSSSSRFSPMLFSKNFIVLCFKFTIHLELIFVKGERTVSRFFFFFWYVYAQSFQHHLCKRLSLLHCIPFSSLSKISWLYLYGSVSWFSTLFCYLLLPTLLLPIPTLLGCFSFIVNLGIE